MQKREYWLDEVKGIGIILVVLGHVVLGFLNAKLYPNITGPLEYVFYTIYSFHMPLFFIISGYLYKKTWKIKNGQDLKKRVINKFIALGVPYIVFSVAFGIIKVVMSGSTNSKLTVKSIISIPIHPIGPYWFLYALMGLFIITPVLEYCKLNVKVVFVLSLIATVSSHFFSTPVVFINDTLQNMLYFYTGCVVYVIFNKEKNIKYKKVGLKFNIILLGIYILINIIYFIICKPMWINNIIISIILAITATLFIINIFYKHKNIRLLSKLGELSLPIYLIHVMFTAGIRIIFMKLGVDEFIIQLIIGVTLGLAVPIVLYKIVTKIKFIDFLFSPTKYYRYK